MQWTRLLYNINKQQLLLPPNSNRIRSLQPPVLNEHRSHECSLINRIFWRKSFDRNCKKYTLFIEFIRFTLIHKQNMAIAINLWPTYGPMLYNNMCWFWNIHIDIHLQMNYNIKGKFDFVATFKFHLLDVDCGAFYIPWKTYQKLK